MAPSSDASDASKTANAFNRRDRGGFAEIANECLRENIFSANSAPTLRPLRLRACMRVHEILSVPIRTRCPILVQKARQELPGVGFWNFGDSFRRPLSDHVSPALPAFRPQINHPVRGLDDLKIVLDENN